MYAKLILFLVLNFLALGVGSFFTSKGVPSHWYANLNKAPWTPPGWVFGAAWTFIMVCFAIYMAIAWKKIDNHTNLLILFALQWVFNVLWNPVFFKFNFVFLGLIIISILTLIIGVFIIKYNSQLKFASLLIAPYFIWLLIATSLNAYIYLKN